MTKIWIVIFFATLSVFGCCNYMPADSFVTINGVATLDKGCNVELLLDGEYIDPNPLRTYRGPFETSFLIPFCNKEYTVQVICDDELVYENVVILPKQSPFNIGQIKP